MKRFLCSRFRGVCLWQGLSGPSGCLRLQMPAKLQEQEESKPEAPVLFSLPLLYPLSKANPILNPDASVKWEKGLPLFTGGADNYGHFIICSFGFFCKLLPISGILQARTLEWVAIRTTRCHLMFPSHDKRIINKQKTNKIKQHTP